MNRSKVARGAVLLGCVLCLTLALAGRAAAQDKGTLAYNGDKDAAYLILDGRNDNRAARLSVDGDENLRGFLELHRDGSVRVSLYVDDEGEGGIYIHPTDGRERQRVSNGNVAFWAPQPDGGAPSPA